MTVVNAAAYKFAPLSGLKEMRQSLRRLCQRANLRGTVLLASEGINLFVAGDRAGVDRLLGRLQEDDQIGPLDVKESFTVYQPFNRMLVKIKREIIAFGVAAPHPNASPTRKIAPRQLAQWLDERRELTLLDTRNDYEVKLGTFVGAETADIDHFRDFPQAAGRFPMEWRRRPLVMFCTGGIRCEKAGPWLEQLGFEEVYQLDGGILNYFQQVGQMHYRGDCFVFDQRVAVDAALHETDAAQCYACQAILTLPEQQSPDYVVGASCPYCRLTSDEQLQRTLAERRKKLHEVATPLPGSVPYDNRRPIYVPARCADWMLVDCLAAVAPRLGRDRWQEQIALGNVLQGERRVAAEQAVAAGERYDHLQRRLVEPDVDPHVEILYEDAAIVVVHKPAPLPMHPCGRFHKNTLAALLEPLYLPERLRNAHRLDANATGVVVFTRSQRMARRLQPQFDAGEVVKRYLARVQGRPAERTFSCSAPIAVDKSAAGIRLLDPEGLAAETRFEVRHEFADATTLVEAQPLTGRTNQIRLHLWSLGLPIVGDPAYLTNGRNAPRQTLSPSDPPMCLHAWRIAFKHPAHGALIEFAASPPSWAMSET